MVDSLESVQKRPVDRERKVGREAGGWPTRKVPMTKSVSYRLAVLLIIAGVVTSASNEQRESVHMRVELQMQTPQRRSVKVSWLPIVSVGYYSVNSESRSSSLPSWSSLVVIVSRSSSSFVIVVGVIIATAKLEYSSLYIPGCN